MIFRNLLLLFFATIMLSPVFAQDRNLDEFMLSNGMKVLVKEDHRAPTVVHMIWYRAGAMDEGYGISGVAHMLEHMMFKGTKTLKPGDFSRQVASLGGRENAFTSYDYTAYYQQVGSNKLEHVMALEADRMVNLVLDDAIYKPELQVVKEERRWRTEDRPMGRVRETLLATAFMAHPYGRPVIGWMNDLEQMTVKDVQAWYQHWYAPNNAVMVVAGDVRAQDVLKMAQKHFGPIPARESGLAHAHVEPEQRGMRRAVVKAPAENPYVIMAFKVPGLRDVENDEEAYALDVLAAVLDGYDNARLNASIVRTDKVAHNVSANYDAIARGPVLFYLSGTPANGVSTHELEKRLRAEVERVAKEGVTKQELSRVKAQLLASEVFKRDSLLDQAIEIGSLEMVGFHHKDSGRMISKLKAVTSKQVQDVAKKYFGDDGMSVVTLVPQRLPKKKSVASEKSSQRHIY